MLSPPSLKPSEIRRLLKQTIKQRITDTRKNCPLSIKTRASSPKTIKKMTRQVVQDLRRENGQDVKLMSKLDQIESLLQQTKAQPEFLQILSPVLQGITKSTYLRI